jgi:hypothetical protein
LIPAWTAADVAYKQRQSDKKKNKVAHVLFLSPRWQPQASPVFPISLCLCADHMPATILCQAYVRLATSHELNLTNPVPPESPKLEGARRIRIGCQSVAVVERVDSLLDVFLQVFRADLRAVYIAAATGGNALRCARSACGCRIGDEGCYLAVF